MSMIQTLAAWQSSAPSDAKLGLLALAEIVATRDDDDDVTMSFSSIDAFQRLTGWTDTVSESFIRHALGLAPDYPLGGMSGIDFKFSDAVAAFEAKA